MSSQRLQEDYLTCSLCSKPFTQPKTLPCLHNYCKACLSAYLENAMSGGRHSTFNCPDCRKKIYVPDPSKAVNRWAAQFPTNFTLSGMIEAIQKEAEGKGKGADMVKKALERRGTPDERDKGTEPSSTKGKLKRDASGEVMSEVKDMKSKLDHIQEHLQKENKEITEFKSSLQNRLEDQKRRLEQSFNKVYTLIEGRKAELIEELTRNFTEEEDRLEQTQQTYSNDMESVKSCSELLHSLDEKPVSGSVVSDMLQAIEDQTREIEHRPTQVVPRTIKFEQTLEAGRSVLTLITELGRVTMTTSGEMARDGGGNDGSKPGSRQRSRQGSLVSSAQNSFDTDGGEAARPSKILAKPRFLTAISTRLNKEQIQQVYDITVMASGTVVLTSYGSNLIMAAKKFGNEYKIFSQLQLDTVPKCVATIAPFFVAVVGSSCFYVIVVDEKLTLKRTVHTGKDYTGIAAYSQDSLILSAKKPASIDFVGLNGFISETIDRDHTTGNVLLKSPQFISTCKGGVILVTDISRSPKLLCLNNAGKVKFQYPAEGSDDLVGPQGICADSQGHILVVDRTARKVIMLNPFGEKIKDLLTADEGITDPCAIAVDEADNVYVTNDFNEVLIFKIK